VSKSNSKDWGIPAFGGVRAHLFPAQHRGHDRHDSSSTSSLIFAFIQAFIAAVLRTGISLPFRPRVVVVVIVAAVVVVVVIVAAAVVVVVVAAVIVTVAAVVLVVIAVVVVE
jgi:hypothetical protein